MPEATGRPEYRGYLGDRTSWRRTAVLAAGVGVVLIVVFGGYEHHWPWTGIDGKTATLWDWLHLLLLPIAIVILPIWLRRRDELGSQHKAAGMAIFTAFVLVVLFGYLTPWTWTGFTGNTFWDWLELLALPLAVALIPVIRGLHATWRPRDWLFLLAGLLLFLVPVLGGYLGNWSWTGFRGNTLWDWLHLLILPLLVPTILVPALKPFATPRPSPQSEGRPAPAAPEAAPLEQVPSEAKADAALHSAPEQVATAPAHAQAPPLEYQAPRNERSPARARTVGIAGGVVAVVAAVAVVLAIELTATPSANLKQDVNRLNAIVQLFIAGKRLSQVHNQYGAAAQNRTQVLERLSALQSPAQLRGAAATLSQMTADSLAYNLLMAQGESAQAQVPDAAHNALRPQFVSQFNPYTRRYLGLIYTTNDL